MDQEIETIEQSFKEIPEEIKAYVYSSSFVKSFEDLCLSENLSKEETTKLRVSLYSYISQLETEEELLVSINSISKNIESNQKIIDWVREKVVEKILTLVTEAYINEEVDEETDDSSKENLTPTSKIPLSSVQERLSQITTIVPSKRDYSVEKPVPTPEEIPKKPTIDPYRELPEK